MASLAPIAKGWISTTGETGAQNYDEFADDAEITAIVEANPRSMLAVEMAHRTPEMLAEGADRERSLRYGAERLQRLKDDGLLAAAQDFVVAYEIDAPTGRQLGIGLMAPTAEIWDAERNPDARIIRNEDVFPEKVEYYADVIRTLRHLPSAVMLAAPDADAAVRDAVEEVVRLRPPTVTSRDQKGNEHRVRVVSDPAERDRVLASLEGKELLVADGNHRSRASERAGLDAFFAVVLSAETMHIDEYHRGFRELGMGDDKFLARVREAGFDVGETGTIELYSRSGRHGLTPRVERRLVPETLEHQLVEERIVRGVLGWDPSDHRIVYVGGDYGSDYLAAEVEAGRFQVALGMPAVTMADFVAVNERRLKMPRKSTWFTPKLRAGLVVVEP
ncbi:MAG: DUF1015 domain-containing protein [Actinobacteria bacterium]|nr:MAG: DUF1015 domain-containing protein [Actinomycetota bacterium]